MLRVQGCVVWLLVMAWYMCYVKAFLPLKHFQIVSCCHNKHGHFCFNYVRQTNAKNTLPLFTGINLQSTLTRLQTPAEENHSQIVMSPQLFITGMLCSEGCSVCFSYRYCFAYGPKCLFVQSTSFHVFPVSNTWFVADFTPDILRISVNNGLFHKTDK